MPEKTNDEFTFSVEDNEYVIKKKSNSEKKQHQKSIHGPSIVIGVSITALCVLGIFFVLNGLVTDDQKLIEVQITETETLSDQTQISDMILGHKLRE